jgi:hypothetical protein
MVYQREEKRGLTSSPSRNWHELLDDTYFPIVDFPQPVGPKTTKMCFMLCTWLIVCFRMINAEDGRGVCETLTLTTLHFCGEWSLVKEHNEGSCNEESCEYFIVKSWERTRKCLSTALAWATKDNICMSRNEFLCLQTGLSYEKLGVIIS